MSTIDGLTVEERGGPEGSCDCDMSVSHYVGCACHETRRDDRESALAARIERLEEALREIKALRCGCSWFGNKRTWCGSCIARAALAGEEGK